MGPFIAGLLIETYFCILTNTAAVRMTGGQTSSRRTLSGAWILAFVWLMGAPSAYGGSMQTRGTNIGVLVVHRTLWDRLLFRHRLSSLAEHTFEIGASGTKFTDKGPMGQVLSEMHIGFERQDDSVRVSAHLFDKTGKTVAAIEDGRWHAPPTGISDLNYSDDALEVKSAGGRIVLQVRLLPDRIQVQVESWNPAAGRGIRLGAQRDRQTAKYSGAGAFVKILTLKSDPDEPRIEPLFLYPGKSNLGRYANAPWPPSNDNEVLIVPVLIFAILLFACVLTWLAMWRRERSTERT
jgi:hypothetical protein